MKTKQQVREILEQLPDNITLEDVQYAIYIRQQIAEGLADIKAGRVYDQQEFDQRMARWLGKSGGQKKPRKTSTR